MMSAQITKVQYRSGTRFAVGVTIDQYLAESETQKLYASWERTWGIPLEFAGGQIAITCEMVQDVPLTDLVKAYGRKFAERLLTVARQHSAL